MGTKDVSLLGLLLLRTVGITLYLLAFLVSLFDAETRNGPDDKKKALLRQATHQAWALGSRSAPYHNFLQLESGLQLHYLSSQPAAGKQFKSLVVFLHGFPDASTIWLRQLEAQGSESTLRIAVDLPGCGGSDALESYGPNKILTALTDAIIQLKKRHLNTSAKGQCVLVGHDWGGVLAYRLAAETEGLFDRLLIVNSIYPLNAEANAKRRIRRAKQYVTAWTKQPSNLRPLVEAAKVVQPVLNQMWKSKYIGLVTLPNSWTGALPWVGRSVRYFNVKLALQLSQRDAPKIDTTTAMALCCGPDETTCKTALASGETYSNQVLARSISHPPGRWDDRVRLYQEGAVDGKWTTCPPRYQTKNTDAKFKCPVYIIHGVEDIAFDKRIIVDHMEEFFQPGTKNADIVILPGVGHWNMIGDRGAAAIEEAFTKMKV